MSENIVTNPIIDKVVRAIEEALGLQPDEKFNTSGSRFGGPMGSFIGVTVRDLCTPDRACYLFNILEYPETINFVQFLTGAEEAICKALGARWISRNKGSRTVQLWCQKPTKLEDGTYACATDTTVFASDPDLMDFAGAWLGELSSTLFPTIEEGEVFSV